MEGERRRGRGGGKKSGGNADGPRLLFLFSRSSLYGGVGVQVCKVAVRLAV